jgi:integrase
VRDDSNANHPTPDQLRLLLAGMSRTRAAVSPALALLGFTGMRVGDATRLQWSDIDETSAAIHMRRMIGMTEHYSYVSMTEKADFAARVIRYASGGQVVLWRDDCPGFTIV